METEITQERSSVTTRIPGSKWLDVEVEFAGREARLVRAKSSEGTIEVSVETLMRIERALSGSRSAVGDSRGVCQIHGFYPGDSWMSCSLCEAERRALIEPQAPQKLLNGDGTEAF